MTPDSSSLQHYMLFFRNSGHDTYRHLSADDRQQLISRWNKWFEKLVVAGKGVEGQPLEPETRLVSGPGGQRVTDGPFPEAKEAIGGYVTVLASSMEEATDIAREHPGLEHGLIIEIRKLTPDCHLGVATKARPATVAVSR